MYNITKSNRTGSALVLAVMMCLLMLVLAMTLIGFAYFTSEQAYFYHDYAQALYTAEAGLNRVIASADTSNNIYLTGSLDTAQFANCRYYAYYSRGTGTYAIASSRGTVTRLRSVHRIVLVQVIPGDSPWNHMIWGGGNTIPAGNDPTTYPPGYNSTTNGPVYNKQYIPRYTLDSTGKWTPYYQISTTSPNCFLSRTTTIGSTAGLTYSWSGNVCTIRGTFTGLIYVEGSIMVSDGLTVNGTLISVGGNITIDKSNITINQNTTRMNYVSLACIDTTATDNFSTWTTNPNAGRIIQSTGNATLIVRGGAVYCSGIYAKNGQGTDIDGVIVCMGADINGFPSGSYQFDPDVHLNPPLGFDMSRFTSRKQIASKSWRELPYSM
ncbi:MAG: hypothetical protein N3A72_11280 [bacterium]|nr:hypothetical protein [bacterium]